MNDVLYLGHATNVGFGIGAEGSSQPFGLELGRQAGRRGGFEHLAVVMHDEPTLRPAEPKRVFEHGLEYRLEPIELTARTRGWTVVSIADDWDAIYAVS